MLDLDMMHLKLRCLVSILCKVMSTALGLSCWNFSVDGSHLIGE